MVSALGWEGLHQDQSQREDGAKEAVPLSCHLYHPSVYEGIRKTVSRPHGVLALSTPACLSFILPHSQLTL